MAASWTSSGCPAGPSDTGAFRLEWSGPKDATFRLEKLAETGEATLVYQGADTATTITGAKKGEVQFRVGTVTDGSVSAWSKTCAVTVSPPSMTLTLLLFSIGAVVSVCTVVAILRGHKAHRAGEIG